MRCIFPFDAEPLRVSNASRFSKTRDCHPFNLFHYSRQIFKVRPSVSLSMHTLITIKAMIKEKHIKRPGINSCYWKYWNSITYAVTASITLDDVSLIFFIKWPALPLRKFKTPPPEPPPSSEDRSADESRDDIDPFAGEGHGRRPLPPGPTGGRPGGAEGVWFIAGGGGGDGAETSKGEAVWAADCPSKKNELVSKKWVSKSITFRFINFILFY